MSPSEDPTVGDDPPDLSLLIPKNRSTGNLQARVQPDRSRIRFSVDAQELEMTRSPILEHEHGLGASGLRRIRQQAPHALSRAPTLPSSASSSFTAPAPVRAATSGNLSLPAHRINSYSNHSAGPASPILNFGEDLSRFPSESLHSFSFATQSDDFIQSRQNILKRSVEFMRDRLGWPAAHNPSGLASAHAKISGDHEFQGMVDLLNKASLIGHDRFDTAGAPLTGPPATDEHENVFDQSFRRSPSPEVLRRPSYQEISTQDAFGLNITIDQETIPQEPSQTTPPAPVPRSTNLRRTYTDTGSLSIQTKLMEALAQPYVVGPAPTTTTSSTTTTTAPPEVSSAATGRQSLSPETPSSGLAKSSLLLANSQVSALPAVHGHGHGHASRWVPAAQAIFTTESSPPWTILAANDLACLVFGVTKAELRKLGILEVVREERRDWLRERLEASGFDGSHKRPPPYSQSQRSSPRPTVTPITPATSPPSALRMGGGVTAQLLSKPSWRARRAQTDDGSGSSMTPRKQQQQQQAQNSSQQRESASANHPGNKSRGVLLCGDVVPIQKRNGATGSASLWVKEKRGGLIWVLEEITEDVAYVDVGSNERVERTSGTGASAIWGERSTSSNLNAMRLVPHLPMKGVGSTRQVDVKKIQELRYFTALNAENVHIPATIDPVDSASNVEGICRLKVSSFPHIAGIMVLSASDLTITSSNSVFSAALFGQSKPDGLSITDLLPEFDRILTVVTEEDNVALIDGMVIPEHSFRRARALLALREGSKDALNAFLRPNGLPARHRDGSEIRVDVQMRVVKSDTFVHDPDENVIEEEDEGEDDLMPTSEMVYALWITYSRHLHAMGESVLPNTAPASTTGSSGTKTRPSAAFLSRPGTPPHQPSPGQTPATAPPPDFDSDTPEEDTRTLVQQPEAAKKEGTGLSLTQQIQEATSAPISSAPPPSKDASADALPPSSRRKKNIEDFLILEDMGQGAYGQVKLARYRKSTSKVVLKYVTKRRILVDTWTRDRRLGTVPLEIHVLDYLRRDGLRHPNIVEMIDFFEDDINYYIEMVPHGLPGMDLFDYIELRVNMEERECQSIFAQVASAIAHLHTKAFVVHRDIKDENVVLDGDGNIKLIDFGSAAYIKNGPFDVFVGTIDYAAPEVLAGRRYRGKEQDVWALGILLYTIIYKENPFYSIDEIMDHDLRVPYVMSENSIDLVRKMLDRDVESRVDIQAVKDHPWLRDRDK